MKKSYLKDMLNYKFNYIQSGNTISAQRPENIQLNGGFNPSGVGFTGNYSMYVNGYFVVNGSRYTKHFFIEGQRIVSKISERSIAKEIENIKAGHGNTNNDSSGNNGNNGGGKVDYDKKQKLSKEALYAAYYAAGMQPFIPTAGNSEKIPYGQLKKYFNTKGNNGNNGNGNNGNGSNPDTTTATTNTRKYENLQFFYHPDHLGSSNYITDASGEVYQHNEYFPYGETFVEERNAAEYTNYLFSGKELDEETGLYYFGVRYMDPRTSLFINRDPLEEKYPGISPYAYCANNPIIYVDPDGREKIKSLSSKDPRNANINKAADNYPKNGPVIHIWAHGNDKGIEVVGNVTTGETVMITTPDGFNQFLSFESQIWSEKNDNNDMVIVLHSCETGKGESSFAQDISNSEKFKDVLIVAPDENVTVETVGTNSATSQEKGVYKGNGEKGNWRFFRNGKQVNAMQGDTKPLFNNPRKTNEQYDTN